MSNHDSRRKKSIYLTKSERKKARIAIIERDGNNCHWCGEPMLDIYTCGVDKIEDAATIEHYFALLLEKPKNIDHLRLAHKRCNR
jgi:5-methylcytosine-specific restriction endonuclease McrA